ISENKDPQRDERRTLKPGDTIHPTAVASELAVGDSHQARVYSRLQYNWSGVKLTNGATYSFSVPPGQQWLDGDIECGPEGWTSEQLPWGKEHIVKMFEDRRRVKEANWFELIGALGDEDDMLFRIGKGDTPYTAIDGSELYLFANDLKTRYDNNEGWLDVTITRSA
ncbi:MAG TPA: hypothetical protein VET88_15455, partial [Gammaproteobacteria bacterium]|nr:hypothetical protein [Gammaproteobacteria bacterium]